MKKRKKKIWKIAIPIVVVVAVICVVLNMSNSSSATLQVYTEQVTRGSISSELSTSGTVKAENKVTYFSPINGKIEGVQVEVGDVVKNGDMLVCFDAEAVAFAKKQSEIDSQISNADYIAAVQDTQKQKEKLAKAESDIAVYEIQVDNYQAYIEELEEGITDVNALRKADLYAKIYSVEKEMNNYDLAIQTPTEETNYDELLRKKTEKANELNKLQNELNLLADYKTDYGWEDLLTQAKKELSDYQTKLQEAKSDKASAEASIQNDNKITTYQLTKEKSVLSTQNEERKYTEALNGIMAEYDGVVTELTAVEGASIQEGTQLLVLESYDNICVEFQASKYDLEELGVGQPAVIDISGKRYEGTVVKIDKMAQPNSSGVPMVGARVHIDNPDDNVYLGIEARLTIVTKEEDSVLLVPVEAVNMDNEGEFCFIIENGTLVKKYVSTGISSAEYIQITDGLAEGDSIVTSSFMGMDLIEGMTVTAMDTMAVNTAADEIQTEAETDVTQE